MIFSCEGDVRRWLRAKAQGGVWWIENGRGGTFGFPDAVVSHSGRAVFLELKIMDRGKIEAHPSQLNAVDGLRRDGLPAAFLCGVKGAESDGQSLRLLGSGALRRASEHVKVGRQTYECTAGDLEGVFSGSDLDAILESLVKNDFPGGFL